MKPSALLALAIVLVAYAPLAKADSTEEYNAGYNAALQSYAPPGTDVSENYYAGWEAGREAAEQRDKENAPQAEEPQEQDSSPPQE